MKVIPLILFLVFASSPAMARFQVAESVTEDPSTQDSGGMAEPEAEEEPVEEPIEEPVKESGGDAPSLAPQIIVQTPRPDSTFRVDGQAFLFYGALYDRDNKHRANTYGLTRGLLNFRFDPMENIGFRFTADVVGFNMDPTIVPEMEGGTGLGLRHAWVELKELIPFAEKLSVFAGLVNNSWNTFHEEALGLRYVMMPAITRYGMVPESDLGVWIRGEVVPDLHLSIGMSNGSGAIGTDMNRTKALDAGAFYRMQDPLNLGLNAYVRHSMDPSTATGDELRYVHSLTGGFAAFIQEKMYRVGVEYLFHLINDFTPDGLGEYDPYRHMFHVLSASGVITPMEQVSAFLRFDAIVYNTKWIESYTHTGQTLMFGAAFHYNKHFTIAVDFQLNRWTWDKDDPNQKNRNFKGSYHEYIEPLRTPDFMQEQKGIFVHTEWKF